MRFLIAMFVICILSVLGCCGQPNPEVSPTAVKAAKAETVLRGKSGVVEETTPL